MNFKSLPQLLDYFKDEKTCAEYFEKQRWGGVITCPHCGHEKAYRTNRGFKCASKTCYKKFTVKVGTIFENSNISLRLWYATIWLCSTSKKGISSHNLAGQLNITQKSAWFLLHRVREILKSEAPETVENPVYEIDEAYIGGKLGNKHAKDIKRLGLKGYDNKTPILSIVERVSGTVINKVLPEAIKEHIYPVIGENIPSGATVHTDNSKIYASLWKSHAHESVNHLYGEYVRGTVHTNTVEGYFSILKRGIYGIYHQVSPKHLHRYCNEFGYRYNTRKKANTDRFDFILTHTQGQLKYKTLIGKA